jgi:hypothetical protein
MPLKYSTGRTGSVPQPTLRVGERSKLSQTAVWSPISSFCKMAALQAHPWCSFQDDLSCNTGTLTLPSCNVTEEKKKHLAEEVRKTKPQRVCRDDAVLLHYFSLSTASVCIHPRRSVCIRHAVLHCYSFRTSSACFLNMMAGRLPSAMFPRFP